MLQAYWSGLDLHGRYPFDLDFDAYFKLDRDGRYALLTARAGSTLLGLFGSVLVPTLHRKNVLTAFGDVLLVSPTSTVPWLGYKMLKAGEKGLRQAGAQIASQTMASHTDFTPFLKRLGYKRLGETWEKDLGP